MEWINRGHCLDIYVSDYKIAFAFRGDIRSPVPDRGLADAVAGPRGEDAARSEDPLLPHARVRPPQDQEERVLRQGKKETQHMTSTTIWGPLKTLIFPPTNHS